MLNLFKKIPGYYDLLHWYMRFRDPYAFNSFLVFAKPGEYYSPIPDKAFIEKNQRKLFNRSIKEITGIKISCEEQCGLIKSFADYYRELPFQAKDTKGFRYYFDNNFYGYFDGLILYSMIRHYRPERIVEVGSGFSSALMLDSNDLFFNEQIHFTFVEPYPERLLSLLKGKDRRKNELIIDSIQNIEPARFRELKENDILFIDSSHIAKIGSDVVYLLTEILPCLNKGVIIHLHDIFWPFEYPLEWLLSGRAWNEAYYVKAFLQFNQTFKILVFNSYLEHHQGDMLKKYLPLSLKEKGSSLWLQKTA